MKQIILGRTFITPYRRRDLSFQIPKGNKGLLSPRFPGLDSFRRRGSLPATMVGVLPSVETEHLVVDATEVEDEEE